MVKLATTNHQEKEDILWALWLLSHVKLDTAEKDPVPGLVNTLDLGVAIPHLVKAVIKGTYCIYFQISVLCIFQTHSCKMERFKLDSIGKNHII